MKSFTLAIANDYEVMHVSNNTPEKALLCALLERAIKDLDITVANGYNNLKNSISWFRGSYDLLVEYEPPAFTFKVVAEELRLSYIVVERIEHIVKIAEQFVESNPGREPGKGVTWTP